MIKVLIITACLTFSAAAPERIVPTAFQQKNSTLKKKPKKDNPPVGIIPNYGKYEFSFESLEGRKYNLNEFSGKILLVNIWAPWCEPCKKETGGLVHIYDNYHSKGLNIVGIAVQTTPQEVRKFTNAHKVRWPVGINDDITKQYKPVGIPASYLFDAKGNLIKEFVGYADEKALEAVLGEIFRTPRPVKPKRPS